MGVMRDRERTICEIAGCESLMPGLPVGTRAASHSDVIGIAGISTSIAHHLVLRGAGQLHRPGGEDLSLFETSVSLGYRF